MSLFLKKGERAKKALNDIGKLKRSGFVIIEFIFPKGLKSLCPRTLSLVIIHACVSYFSQKQLNFPLYGIEKLQIIKIPLFLVLQ